MALGPSISSHAIALVNFQIYLPYFSDRNGLQYNARKEEEAKDLLKKYKENLVKAKLERNYYNKNTKLTEQQRKLVDEHFITRGKASYCSVDATAHYSYDWAQNVHVPHSDQQVSKIYYLSPRKVHLLVFKMKQYANKLITFSMKMKQYI